MTTNRACPSCGKDCGQAAENYGHLSGIYQYTNCKACGQRLVSDFAYPSFFWKVANDNIPSDGAQPVAIAQAFKHCCAKFIRDLWASCGGPMNIVNFEGHYPECSRHEVYAIPASAEAPRRDASKRAWRIFKRQFVFSKPDGYWQWYAESWWAKNK